MQQLRRSQLFKLGTIVVLSLFSTPLPAALTGGTSAPGEFPAISMLPPGTVVEGITLPRYEGPRISSLIKANSLRVLSRHEVSIKGLLAEVYDKEGYITAIKSDTGDYNFRTSVVQTTGKTFMKDQRFRAQGKELTYSAETQRGILRGPVRTILSLPTIQEKKPKTP